MKETSLSSPPNVEPSQRDRAYQALRRLLILQQVPDGERLREPVWAKQLGVNRMALREAFARLEAEGLIERGPKTGYFVPRLTADDLQEILEVRVSLEAMAIRRIIKHKRNTRRHLEPLQRAIDQLAEMIENKYMLGTSESDRLFHEKLVELAGNRRLTMIYLRAPLPMLHAHLATISNWDVHMRKTLKEHGTILELLLKGDAKRAELALYDHLGERPA
jgi:DNA-binding GntR family transcriptional regulator